jgi:hypothetical protein
MPHLPGQEHFKGSISRALQRLHIKSTSKAPYQEHFKGSISHSSDLEGKSARGKKVGIIGGGGASAVEALEFVAREEASHTTVLARSEKWIIPRNPFVDSLFAMNILGSETIFSGIPEYILRLFVYTDLYDLSPPSTPLEKVSSPKPQW